MAETAKLSAGDRALIAELRNQIESLQTQIETVINGDLTVQKIAEIHNERIVQLREDFSRHRENTNNRLANLERGVTDMQSHLRKAGQS